MQDTIKQKRAFAVETIETFRQFLDAYNDLVELRQRYADTGFIYSQEDFEHDSLQHLTPQTFVDALATLDAVKTLLDAGHRSNINKVIG